MAHFAGIDENNVVRCVNRIDDGDAPTEAAGVTFCRSLWGDDLRWVQTSYNGNFRKNFACIGGVYDQARNAFIGIKPLPEFVLNEESCVWEPPIQKPAQALPAGSFYVWDSLSSNWVVVEDVR